MKILLKALFILAFSVQMQAKEKLISGKVYDDSGLPLPGVAILIKGTSRGTTTDFEGYYRIKAKETDVLVFSYIGYGSEERKIEGLSDISVVLKASLATLDEVVVVGYGTTKKKVVTGAVSKITSESISKRLAGKVSGVKIAKQEPQSGLLTAGEINDLEKWSKWIETLRDQEYKEIQQNWDFYLENKIEVYVKD